MINRVVLVGRITKDPEQKRTQNNTPVVSFSLAVDSRYTNDQGEKKADFIQCVAWNKSAEFMANYVCKGNMLGVEGRIQTRTYETNNGETRYVTEVVCDSVQLLESKREQAPAQPSYEPDENPFTSSGKSLATEEDLPF
ncbi:single-stranded DNA-binding protein [Acholeplasma vituli]|uniref:Single-stranded DNA-binding protein n=1 Tax=Paracholeplasma vituli TaxID=69473 RepID=A0ABT2PTQ8_9MOLU|nr:single-stranded DNA-binding protein [Paracholeplasma vituli]MCU0104334.1 single-stranded DNA-binding protein [Paracholeplasma vituli]